ncbi:uncharacterized protein LOC144141664 [Haemaphysalis longicornis]
MRVVFFAGLLAFVLSTGHAVLQFSRIMKCSRNYTSEIMGVLTRDSVVGSYMTVKIKFRVYDTTLRDLKLKTYGFTPYGRKLPCIKHFGSCNYDLCKEGPHDKATMLTAQCPIKPGTYWRNFVFHISPKMRQFIDDGNVIMILQLESGRKTVACGAMHLQLYKAQPDTEQWD